MYHYSKNQQILRTSLFYAHNPTGNTPSYVQKKHAYHSTTILRTLPVRYYRSTGTHTKIENESQPSFQPCTSQWYTMRDNPIKNIPKIDGRFRPQAQTFFNYYSPLSEEEENEPTCKGHTTPTHPTGKHQLTNTTESTNSSLLSLSSQTNASGRTTATLNTPHSTASQHEKNTMHSHSGSQTTDSDPSKRTPSTLNTSKNTKKQPQTSTGGQKKPSAHTTTIKRAVQTNNSLKN